MKIPGILAAVSLVIVTSQAAGAQSLASRIAAVRDGKVRMTFATRDDICGYGNGISTRSNTRNNWSDSKRSDDVEYDVDCSEGPARIVVQMEGGHAVNLKAYVGGRWRPASNVRDIGAVGVKEATDWLLDVARSQSGKVASSAIFAVTLADSVQMAQPLYAFATSSSNPREAREQAIFWMGQMDDDRVVGYLERILRDSREEKMQDKAIFSLSQHRSDRSQAILKEFAENENESDKLRGQAVFWLGQSSRGEGPEYLRSLYSRVRSEELKDKVIFSVSQQRGVDSENWLLDLVANEREPVEMRKKALFWAGQGGASMKRLSSLYSKTTDREMKDQMIFVFSQHRDAAAFEKLMDIAKNDPDRQARRKAMFWLGQSKDPRVASMLSDMINK